MTVRKWGVETLVNTNTANFQAFSSVTTLLNGDYVIAWTDLDPTGGDGSGMSVKFQRYDATGARIGGETIANFDATGDQLNRDIVATDDGGFVMVWVDNSTIEYRRFDANGVALDTTTDRVFTLSGDQFNPKLATLGTGFAMAFLDGFGDVRVQRFLANGDADGAIIDVAVGASGGLDPDIAETADGGFVVAWEDGTTDRVRLRGFDATGAQTFAAVDVSDVADTDVLRVSVTALAGGAFVVVWQNNGATPLDSVLSIAGRIVAADGTLIGSEFAINTQTAEAQSDAKVAALPDGGFVAVYTSDDEIRAQVFDATGARKGSEFVVNTSMDGEQGGASVAALADGRFVVTWTDVGTAHPDDGDSSSVRQQIFDPRDGSISGTVNADTLFGHDAVNDELSGFAGADTLNGLGGADWMYGGEQGDTYIVDNAGDRAFELAGQGTDLVRASVSFTLDVNVENLTLTGSAAAGTGNGLANIITGNAVANTLNGLGGADTMLGLAGNDSYVVDNVLDTVDETAGGGIDTVSSSFNFSLVASARVIGAFENLTLTGAAVTGTGNNAANVITGNNTVNVLSGGIGNDTLRGLNGNDTLIGGVGIDTLTGGLNNDSFVFNAPLNAANRDTVTDFNHVNDVFRLENGVMGALGGPGALNPGFFFAGAAAHDANDHVIYNKVTGALFFDSNGIAAGGVTQLATLSNRPNNIAANDFVVI